MKTSLLIAEHILSEIERILQSFEEFMLDGAFDIDIIHVKNPKGGVWSSHYIDLDSFLKNKQCIIHKQNKDELCCARAIITAKAKIDNHPLFKESIKRGGCISGQLAKELHVKANVPLGVCGIDDIKRFQTVLADYQIHFVSRDHFNGMIYTGPEVDKKIYRYLHDNHYDVICSMAAFLNKSYFCTKCNTGYDRKEEHEGGGGGGLNGCTVRIVIETFRLSSAGELKPSSFTKRLAKMRPSDIVMSHHFIHPSMNMANIPWVTLCVFLRTWIVGQLEKIPCTGCSDKR